MTLYCVKEKRDLQFWTNQWEQWKLRGDLRFMANITPDQLPEGIWDPWEVRHHNVYINGILRDVVGVEAFASMRSPSSRYKHTFVIAVKR